MWLLSFVPDSLLIWIINALVLFGVVGTVAGFFIKFIPFINRYKLPVQIVSIVVLLLGIYLRGGYSVEKDWRDKVSEAQAKVLKAEAEAKEANIKLDGALKSKVEAIKAERVLIQERINSASAQMDGSCVIIPDVVEILNQAARTGAKK